MVLGGVVGDLKGEKMAVFSITELEGKRNRKDAGQGLKYASATPR